MSTHPTGTAAGEWGGRTVVVGLGATGYSCARYLHARGAAVEVVDSRDEPPKLAALRETLPEVPVHLGGFAEDLLAGADRLVVSPGVSLEEPALVAAAARGVPRLGDVELFARGARAPVVAVTGSNGKSTVTTLLGEMARCEGRRVETGGNLGPPALDLLGREPVDLYVLELSSFQLELTQSLRPLAATVLNVSADHMDRHGSLEAYAAVKSRVFAGEGVMVVNRDDPRVEAMARSDRRVVGFTLGVPKPGDYGVLSATGGDWLTHGETPLLPTSALRIRGRHNVANALAALALGAAAGLSLSAMRAALRAFPGLAHRCQLVAEAGGVRWYNDSKATNVGATVAAVEGLADDGPIVLIAGGDGKGADFEPLVPALRGRVRAAVLLGRDAGRMEAAIGGVVHAVRVDDMGAAVEAARGLARPGDSVLLAPACASLDMYRDYRARGDAFVAAARGEAG